MDLQITKELIDECRSALNEATPYTEEEIFDGSEESDGMRRKATCAKNILEQLGISLTDPNDYGDIEKDMGGDIMNDETYMECDDTSEYWKVAHPEEYAELERLYQALNLRDPDKRVMDIDERPKGREGIQEMLDRMSREEIQKMRELDEAADKAGGFTALFPADDVIK